MKVSQPIDSGLLIHHPQRLCDEESIPLATSALKQLRRLQKSLYDQAYAEAHSAAAGASRTILSYSDSFTASLPATFQKTSLKEVLGALRTNRFLLYGDFHTLRQSQRGLLRILREHVDTSGSSKLVLALEVFKAKDQKWIDGFLNGTVNEVELLEAVDYDREWGFPWPNFRMILEFAREQNLPVIGINSDQGGKDSLSERDRFAAETMVEAAEAYPQHKVICLIGEYHLSNDFLPHALREACETREIPPKIMRVLNNVDRYYFRRGRETNWGVTEYLRLKKDFYCVMNSPPWLKWQSFSIWEEMRDTDSGPIHNSREPTSLAPEPHTEETFDVDYRFFHMAKTLAHFLELPLPGSELERFKIVYSPSGHFDDELPGGDVLPRRETRRALERVLADGVRFIPGAELVLLTRVSINNLSEAAGQFLYSLTSGLSDSTGSHSERFHRRVLYASIGMVASMIMNPRRKCRGLNDFAGLVHHEKRRRLAAGGHSRREEARAVLQYHQWMKRNHRRRRQEHPEVPMEIRRVDHRTDYAVSRAIGQMVGNKLYEHMLAGTTGRTIGDAFTAAPVAGLELWDEIKAHYEPLLR